MAVLGVEMEGRLGVDVVLLGVDNALLGVERVDDRVLVVVLLFPWTDFAVDVFEGAALIDDRDDVKPLVLEKLPERVNVLVEGFFCGVTTAVVLAEAGFVIALPRGVVAELDVLAAVGLLNLEPVVAVDFTLDRLLREVVVATEETDTSSLMKLLLLMEVARVDGDLDLAALLLTPFTS